jgi:8-oxo-dGTP diphosphatase
VLGVAVAARVPDGRWLLVRRADTGHWALPGGTLEWGETLRELVPRELREEAGVEVRTIGRLVGVFSRPGRDPRFHGVTIVVCCDVDMPAHPPKNPLEISEVGLFADAELPTHLSMDMDDMLRAARESDVPIFE